MSMVVMRRRLKAQNKLNKNQEATRGGISSNSGIFALNYTNTGKHLMGRTVSRAKHLPPLLRAFKNRRVDCCKGPSEVVNTQINICVGSSAGIKKIPIKQLSARNYLKQRAYQCGDGSCRGTAADSLWKLSPEAHASSLTERLAAMALNSEKGCIFNYKVTVVTDGGNKFVLDGNSCLNVQFKVGNTYIFDVSDSTNASHPMRFSTTATGSTNYDLIEVLGTQGEKNSKVIFKPKKKGTTWMYCTVHGKGMGSYYNNTVCEEAEINVTVAAKTASHPRSGQGSLSAYFLDNVESPVLKLVKGKTYRFKQNDTTNAGHPIQFWSAADKTGTQYTSTSSGTIGNAGAYVDFTVPANAPNKIYYQCGNHGYMGNYFDIVDSIGVTVLDSDENLIKNRKCYDVERSQNSLLRGRVGCGVMAMTKEIKNVRVAMDASDRIRQIKSRTLNAECITSIKPFNNKKCTPPA